MVASICVIGILLVGLVGTIVLHQVNRQLFDRAVSTHLDQYSSASSRAKAQIETANAPAAGQLQQIANELVASQNNPDGAIVGAALLRSPKQPEATSFEIAEPATESSSRIRTRITAEMKKAVADDDAVHWQSIEVQTSAGNKVPGIIVGSRLNLPGAGYYQFYVAYSLESEEYTTGIVTSILTVGASVFLLFVAVSAALIVRLVLRPVHEASRNASILAQGGFDARMEVKGRDELAQLARSFNQMASSLSDQFTQLERMSKVQQEFVSAVSHELRSPVTTIRMAGQLIYDRRTDLPSVLRRSAELQHDQLINLDVMLSDLLEISRYDAGAMTLASTKADLREIADAVVKAQRPLAESNGVEVIVESRGDTQAKVEPRRIERIVRNLVVNALEHAEGKPVRVLVVGGENADRLVRRAGGPRLRSVLASRHRQGAQIRRHGPRADHCARGRHASRRPPRVRGRGRRGIDLPSQRPARGRRTVHEPSHAAGRGGRGGLGRRRRRRWADAGIRRRRRRRARKEEHRRPRRGGGGRGEP